MLAAGQFVISGRARAAIPLASSPFKARRVAVCSCCWSRAARRDSRSARAPRSPSSCTSRRDRSARSSPLALKLYVLDHFGVPERVGEGAARRIVLHVTMPTAVDQALVAQGYKVRRGRQKMTTLDHRLAVLAAAHRRQGLPSPLLDPALRQLLTDCRKTARLIGEGPRQMTAARGEVLEALLATCDESLAGVRDRAVLLFGWASGGRRRAEIAHAEVSDLHWTLQDGQRQATFTMRESKTGDTSPKPLKGEAAEALWRWIERAGLREGPLFRRLHGPTVGGGLSPHAVNEIIKRRARQAGLDGAQFGGHS